LYRFKNVMNDLGVTWADLRKLDMNTRAKMIDKQKFNLLLNRFCFFIKINFCCDSTTPSKWTRLWQASKGSYAWKKAGLWTQRLNKF
jgi:hypothetical protein